jgi:hypothetical protein
VLQKQLEHYCVHIKLVNFINYTKTQLFLTWCVVGGHEASSSKRSWHSYTKNQTIQFSPETHFNHSKLTFYAIILSLNTVRVVIGSLWKNVDFLKFFEIFHENSWFFIMLLFHSLWCLNSTLLNKTLIMTD